MARWPIPDDLHTRIIHGPLCPFHEHSQGSLDGQIPRYDDSHACVRCIAGLTEGRLSLNIKRIHPRFRRKFLEFWSFVEIGGTDECWTWHGARYKDGSSTYFPLARHWATSSQFAAPRIATWFTWGDVGRLPLEHTCGNKLCCNPLHIRVKGVSHFHHNRRLATLDLVGDTRRLREHTSEFLQLSREQTPERYEKLERINTEWIAKRAAAGEPLFEAP